MRGPAWSTGAQPDVASTMVSWRPATRHHRIVPVGITQGSGGCVVRPLRSPDAVRNRPCVRPLAFIAERDSTIARNAVGDDVSRSLHEGGRNYVDAPRL